MVEGKFLGFTEQEGFKSTIRKDLFQVSGNGKQFDFLFYIPNYFEKSRWNVGC